MLRWTIVCCAMLACAMLAATDAREDDALISFPTTPLLPGSSTLPSYYGRAFDYNYQGAYYGGGGYLPYFFREPYACGVTGYC